MPDTSDPARLAELEGFAIMDTPPEEGFDDVVQIARQLCDAPVALVSFVAADRQWFKARAGFPECETDLNSSVCAHALTEPDLLVIPDLTTDPRTRKNPLVTGEPRIRFYAGAPLRTESGRVLGSLCVIDGKPRPGGLREGEADALRRLGRQVMILLRERQQLAAANAAASRRTALLELGDYLQTASTVADMTAKAAEIVGRTLGGNRAGYGEFDATGEVLSVHNDWTAGGAVSLLGRHRLADYGDIAPMMQRGETLIVRAVSDDRRTADRAVAFVGLGIKAMLNVPVRDRGRTIGLFYVHAPEPRAWLPEEIGFARNVADRVQLSIVRLREEERRKTLSYELSHRMKNVLAIVHGIAAQTLQGTPDFATARQALLGRLVAMGSAHDILLGGVTKSGNLADVIKEALQIHGDGGRDSRVHLDGPSVQVGSKGALSLTLMIHELGTNAVKYGALSVPGGLVTIRWGIFSEDGVPTVRLSWKESGGPLVTPPTRRGFGSRLITRGLAGAKVVLSFPPEGATCELTAPLSEFLPDE